MKKFKNIIFDLTGVLFEQQDLNIGNQHLPLKPLPKGIALLQECFASNYIDKLFICSNWSSNALSKIKQDYPEVITLFDGIVIPDMAQARKPDIKIFTYLLDNHALSAHETIFLDDQEINIKAAEYVGITGIHVQDFDHVKEQLKKLLIII
jgi:FMN phosphatase YigB (HAD superfamily)